MYFLPIQSRSNPVLFPDSDLSILSISLAVSANLCSQDVDAVLVNSVRSLSVELERRELYKVFHLFAILGSERSPVIRGERVAEDLHPSSGNERLKLLITTLTSRERRNLVTSSWPLVTMLPRLSSFKYLSGRTSFKTE